MGVHAGAGASETGGDDVDILIEPVPSPRGMRSAGAADSALSDERESWLWRGEACRTTQSEYHDELRLRWRAARR